MAYYNTDELINMITPVVVAYLQDNREDFIANYGATAEEVDDTIKALALLCDIEILED